MILFSIGSFTLVCLNHFVSINYSTSLSYCVTQLSCFPKLSCPQLFCLARISCSLPFCRLNVYALFDILPCLVVQQCKPTIEEAAMNEKRKITYKPDSLKYQRARLSFAIRLLITSTTERCELVAGGLPEGSRT